MTPFDLMRFDLVGDGRGITIETGKSMPHRELLITNPVGSRTDTPLAFGRSVLRSLLAKEYSPIRHRRRGRRGAPGTSLYGAFYF